MSEPKRYTINPHNSGGYTLKPTTLRGDDIVMHADDYDREHELRLQAEREVVRQREILNGLYADPTDIRTQHAALRGRAEQAERERDRLRKHAEAIIDAVEIAPIDYARIMAVNPLKRAIAAYRAEFPEQAEEESHA